MAQHHLYPFQGLWVGISGIEQLLPIASRERCVSYPLLKWDLSTGAVKEHNLPGLRGEQARHF